MGFQFESSNPALSSMAEASKSLTSDDVNRATFVGTAQKTAMLVVMAAAAGGLAYAMVPMTSGVLLAANLAALIIGLGIGWTLVGNPHYAKVLAPIYAVVEGVFLGLLTKGLDWALLARGIDVSIMGGSLALPAFIITFSCMAAMLGLYGAGILRPTETFKSVIYTLTAAVFLAYLVMFVLSLFGVQLPFLSLGSAVQGGKAALIGLGLNAAILVLASLWLVIDFGKVEQIVLRDSHKDLEWYGAYALLVTLAWIYFEAVKLAYRLAILFGNRK